MLSLPETSYDEPEVLASWLELSALQEQQRTITVGTALETMRDSGLYVDDPDSPESASELLRSTWEVLESRYRLLRDAWPFALAEDSLSVELGRQDLEANAGYLTMLLLEAAGLKWYTGIAVQPGDDIRWLFEHLTRVAVANLLNGTVVRFGAPFDVPGTFLEHVRRLAEEFQIPHREADILAHASPDQEDDSLDVVGRWALADEEPSSPYILIQCATGANWRVTKQGEPRVDLWKEYVSWDGPVLKGLAIPFSLRGSPKRLPDASVRHGNAVVFDRMRLSAGRPDESLEGLFRTALSEWCSAKMADLPQV